MKGRHVVILIFVFGLSLLAILFRVLPSAKPPVVPAKLAPPIESPPPSPPPLPPPDEKTAGSLEALVRSKGAPLRGVAVTFQFVQGMRVHQRTTNAEGLCTVPVAEAGLWRVVARAPGAATSMVTTTVESGKPARVELDLAAGVQIRGTVRDESGNPVAGAKVELSILDPAFTTRTDAQGNYALNNVPIGKYGITASSDRFRPHAIPNLELAVPGQIVPQDFILPFGASASGRVVDETGAPVARASVTISNEVARMVRSDDNGAFQAEGLGEGPLTVSVVARGFAPYYERNVPLGRDIPVRLVRGAVLQGRIDGPPAAFTVHVSRFDEGLQKWLVVRGPAFTKEANGEFVLRDLPPGRYEMTVETSDRRTPAPVALVLQSGQTYDAQVVILTPK